jgi:hypothetical protein
MKQNKVYRIKRTFSVQLTPQTVDSGGVIQMTLGTLPNSSEFTNLFDQYMFEKITVRFRNARTTVPTGAGEAFPHIAFAIDYNDGTSPTTQADVLQYDTCKIHQFAEGGARTVQVSYRPRIAQSSASGNYSTDGNTWVNTSDTSAVWYGLKYFLTNWNSISFNQTILIYDVVVELALRVPK